MIEELPSASVGEKTPFDGRPAMTESVDSSKNQAEREQKPPSESWMRVGTIAALSALAGGLAVAWYYRKTLAQLQEAEDIMEAQEFPPSADDYEV